MSGGDRGCFDADDEQVSAWLRAEALARTIAQDPAGDPADTLVAVAMGGKTIRNTIEPGGAEGSEIKLFSALTHSGAVVIAQHRIPPGTNEITQVRALLDGVDLRRVVVTGDAALTHHTRHPRDRAVLATSRSHGGRSRCRRAGEPAALIVRCQAPGVSDALAKARSSPSLKAGEQPIAPLHPRGIPR